jgi:hypothetical protein
MYFFFLFFEMKRLAVSDQTEVLTNYKGAAAGGTERKEPREKPRQRRLMKHVIGSRKVRCFTKAMLLAGESAHSLSLGVQLRS